MSGPPVQPQFMSVMRDHALGQIYLAVDSFAHARYVVKELRIAPAIGKEIAQEIASRFIEDAKRLAQAPSSPRFAQVLSVRDEPRKESVVFLEPPGPALMAYFQSLHSRDSQALVSVAADTLGIYETLERAGIRRINVIPESFCIGPDGRTQYLDLHFADYETCERALPERMWPEDARFLSPEQAAGQPPSAASQVFSLGVLFYLLARGHTPFEAPSAQAVRNLLRYSEAASIRKERDDLPADFADAIDLALCRDPIGRPQSLAEFREAAKLPDPEKTGVSLIAPCASESKAGEFASDEEETERLGPPPWLGKAAIAAAIVLAVLLLCFLFL